MKNFLKLYYCLCLLILLLGVLLTNPWSMNKVFALVEGKWDPVPEVSIDKEWRVHFNESINQDYLSEEYFYITDDSAQGTVIPTSLRTEDNGATVVIIPPSEGYTPGAKYTLYVSEEVKSISGKLLNVHNYLTFSIASPVIKEGHYYETEYLDNYVIHNYSNTIKEFHLNEAAAYALYDEDGRQVQFGLSKTHFILAPGQYVIISFTDKKERRFNLPEGMDSESHQDPAIWNVTHDDKVSTEWKNDFNEVTRSPEIKATGVEYNYYTWKADGELGDLQHINDLTHSILVSEGGKLVISPIEGKTVQVYAPYKTYSYTKKDEPAVRKIVLAPQESVFASNTSNEELSYDPHYFAIFNENEVSYLDFVSYQDTEMNSAQTVYADERYFNNDLTYGRISPGQGMHMTNLTEDHIYVFTPFSQLALKKTATPATVKQLVQPGETAIITNHFSFPQAVEVGGNSVSYTYDFALYSDFERKLSRDLGSQVYGKVTVGSEDTLVVTPKTGKPEVVAAPFTNTDISVTSKHEALEYYTSQQDQSVYFANDQEFPQYYMIKNGESANIVSYSPEGEAFFQRSDSLQWAGKAPLPSGSAKAYSNISSTPLEFAFPAGSFRIISGAPSDLKTITVGAHEAVELVNMTGAKQHFTINGTTYDYVHFGDISRKKLKDWKIDEQLDRPLSITLKPGETYLFSNATGQTAEITYVDEYTTVNRNAKNPLIKETIAVGGTKTLVNTTDEIQPALLTGDSSVKVNYFKWGIDQPFISGTENINGSLTKWISAGDKISFENLSISPVKLTTFAGTFAIE